MDAAQSAISSAKPSTEAAARLAGERLRGIFDLSAVAVAILTLEGHFLQGNQAFCSITGYSEQELRALDFARLMHPDDGAATNKFMARVAGEEIPSFVLEERWLAKDGRTIWVKNSVSAVCDARRRPEYLIAIVEDVTDLRKADAAVRETEERFRAIFETTPECVKLVAMDGTLLHMNSSGLAMLGAERAEAVTGKSVYPLIAPEFRDAFRDFNEKICRGEKGSLEFDMIGLQGRRRHMESHAAPLHRQDGTAVQLAITRDITERKREERAALLLGAIVDSSDDAIISKDLNGIIMSWNKGAERLFGYTSDEAVGKPVTILIPPDRLEEEVNILRRLRRGERVDHFETIRRRKDGSLRHISLTISPVKDAQDRIIGVSKIARDITERKRAEEAIHELNDRLAAELAAMSRMQRLSTRLLQADDFAHLLGEIVDAGIEITSADMGNIQLIVDGVLKIVSQRGFETPFLDFFDNVHGGQAACGTALQRCERVIVEDVAQSPVFAGTPSLEVMLAAGARAVQSTPLVSRSGQLLGMFSTHYRTSRRPGDRELRLLDVVARQAADLIERNRAEAALAASEQRFRQLADSMPQIVWTARSDGYLDYYNERWYEFTGFDRDRFGDISWEPILHPDDVKGCYETWYGCIRTGQPYRIEYRFWDRRENRWRWFMGRALPVRGEHGKIVKWFGTCTDIDEQKRVEDDLRRANLDLEQFAYSATHDLQEPLRSIKIYSELLAKRYGDGLEGDAHQFLGFLHAGASRMELLVRDLLAYTQVTRLDAPDEVADANAAFKDALANLSGTVSESGARITCDPLPSLHVHGAHLQQLFQNLMGNAIKYRSPGRIPEVHVSAARQNRHWTFSVRDNGIGIEPEYKEHIFGLFKRLHASDKYSGTGIGLAICQRIVERYQGRIWVESEPGRGSNFFFTLPL
jgi:PAS domain S-box-containing protein